MPTKSPVYCACVCSTLLYGSKPGTLSTVQEKKINTNNVSVVFSELGGNIRFPTGSAETWWSHNYVHYPQPVQAFLAWSCSEDNQQTHPEGSTIHRVGRWQTQLWSTKTKLQRRLQARLEDLMLTLMSGKSLPTTTTNSTLLS